MSTIRTSNLGPLTGNTATVVDPATPVGGNAYFSPLVTMPYYNMSGGGTSVDFTGIPSWVSRITITGSGFTAGGYNAIVRLGYGGTFPTTNYATRMALFGNANNTGINSYTDGFYAVGGTSPMNFTMFLHYIRGSGYWHMNGTSSSDQPYGSLMNGYTSALVGQTLTAIRVLNSGGAAMTSGLIQVMYE